MFQHSIDNIINEDTISVDISGPDSLARLFLLFFFDSSLLFLGITKSSFTTLDALSGKRSAFGSDGYSSSFDVSLLAAFYLDGFFSLRDSCDSGG